MPSRRRVRAGDWVRFQYGLVELVGKVTYDCGDVGTDGLQLVQVEVRRGEDEGGGVGEYLVRADEMTLLPRPGGGTARSAPGKLRRRPEKRGA